MDAAIAYLREFHFGTVIIRLILAVVCGGIIGYGRSRQARAAGFRTYMLISVGAAMAVLISIYEYQMLQGPWLNPKLGMKFDASRLVAQALTGIGFLGAGIIVITKKMTIKGLTTAAGL